jgi:C-terminal processing protease CtpA/Prc
LFDYKGICWDSIYDIYLSKAEDSQGDENYQLIYDLLRELKDPHVYFINWGGGLIFPYPGNRWLKGQDTYDPIIARSYFHEPFKFACQNKVEYARYNATIGYIYISNFDDENAMQDFGEVIKSLASTSGLIIDVRRNTGGWTENVSDVISKFLTDSLPFPKAYLKDDIAYFEPAIQPDSTINPYQKPVVILIHGASISAGELFPEIMNQLPNVTLIGDTTAGAGCNDVADDIEADYVLPSGIQMHVGTTYVLRYDELPIEMNGVAPEILITQTKEDIDNGHDPQLEYAIRFLSDSK